jgi:hypothetical protein
MAGRIAASSLGRIAIAAALAAAGAGGAPAESVRCESIGGRAASCPLAGGAGVALGRQLGGAPCVFGRSFGWDGRRVHVAENCRGEFRTTLDEFELGVSVFCEPRRRKLTRCAADTSAGALVEATEGECALGRSFGFDGDGVWVSDRCAVSFRVGIAPPRGRPLRCDWIAGGPRRFCALDTAGGVVLERPLGSAPCVYGVSWGLVEGGVWVDRGCSALFRADALVATGEAGGAPLRLACAAPAGGSDFCPAPGALRATLAADASGRCVEGRTWRATAHGVYVEDGCAGLFELKR